MRTPIINNGVVGVELIMTNKLEILNRGKRTTYRHEGLDREEVIDLTLSSSILKSRIKDWHVSDEPSLSDHRHICFNMDSDRTTQVPTRIPRKTNWKRFEELLKDSKSSFEVANIGDSAELDRAAEKLTAAILTAYEACCPVVHRKVKRDVPWWGKGLKEQRK
jgi:Endonuclease-reverse transcriptase